MRLQSRRDAGHNVRSIENSQSNYCGLKSCWGDRLAPCAGPLCWPLVIEEKPLDV